MHQGYFSLAPPRIAIIFHGPILIFRYANVEIEPFFAYQKPKGPEGGGFSLVAIGEVFRRQRLMNVVILNGQARYS